MIGKLPLFLDRLRSRQSSPGTKINGHAKETTMTSLTETALEHEESQGHSPLPYQPTSPVASPGSGRSSCEKSPQEAHDYTPNSHTITPTSPAERHNRTLVLCFDGTGDQFDADNSNVVQLFSLLKKDDQSKQMVYYQAGIGTYTSPQIVNPIRSQISKVLAEMVAWDLDAHVMSGYEFLMQNYSAGDRICIFGFSRGAYTGRALAGMLHKVGLLPACNYQQVPFAYKMYTRADKVGMEESRLFKKAFSIDVKIEFIGVWDTVDSVGVISKRLPFTRSNPIVRKFRHALSLDEHRAKFKANLWEEPTVTNEKMATQQTGGDAEKVPERRSKRWSLLRHETNMSVLERTFSGEGETDVQEVWFSGCHCDVGGGSVSNKTPHSLARIPLRWMIRECYRTNVGIIFDPEGLKEIGLDPSLLNSLIENPKLHSKPPSPPLDPDARVERGPSFSSWHSSRKSSSAEPDAQAETNPRNSRISIKKKSCPWEEEDLKDAVCPVYDQLELKWYWWILEVIPMQHRNPHKKPRPLPTPNLARPRVIPHQRSGEVKVHWTVKERTELLYDGENPKREKYSPRARYRTPTWVA